MTLTWGFRTGCEVLAFQDGSIGCGLCGGMGSLPDPSEPLRRLPCPRCGEPPKRRTVALERRIAATLAARQQIFADALWHGLIWSCCGAIALLAIIMAVGVVRLVVG